jgi:hypothetical protein
MFKLTRSSLSRLIVIYWRDITIMVVLAAIAGLASYQGSKLIDPIILHNDSFDSWFNADSPRVFANMSSRGGDHYRTKVHPLFSLITAPLVLILEKMLHIQPIIGVRLVIAVVASLWIIALYGLLRLIGCRRFDSFVFSVLAMTSAMAMFWFVVPEVYSFGSVSILLALVVVAWSERTIISQWWFVAVSSLTLSFTTTNWMAGIIAAFSGYSWKRALQITVNAFCVVVVLWGAQKLLFPSAVFFIGDREEAQYMFMKGAGGPLRVLMSSMFHSMVMPASKLLDMSKTWDWPVMTVQHSFPGTASPWGAVGVALWAVLLGISLWALFTLKRNPRLRIVLGLTLLGQLGLHMVYGPETFLYSLHYGPLLVILAALTTLTRLRVLCLGLAVLISVTSGVNNGLAFRKAINFYTEHGPPSHQVQAQMQLRSADPWPRDKGHVVLSAPGWKETDKAYHEPGGSFSPAPGSFGLSLWITDPKGNLAATSDTIPLSEIDQSFSWADGCLPAGISTKTDYYRALWSYTKEGQWVLNLEPRTNENNQLALVIRSVGPAGGPIRSLKWDGKRLSINDRWLVTIDPAPSEVYLGEEGPKGWITRPSSYDLWKGDGGWGYVRFRLTKGVNNKIVIDDSASRPSTDFDFSDFLPSLELNLADNRFAASLKAQVAHLMMGLVDRQTRPGDPMCYPTSWLRDGAYAVVALARVGKTEVAKKLSIYFAENDFFGGFGAEADAPGLAIWALEEVAGQVDKPEYYQFIWPHVRRKAEAILEMLSTKEPILRPVAGSVIPALTGKPDIFLVADPSQKGLIMGRMDQHKPILYVNAVSYLGLIRAALIAERIGRSADALRWRGKAVELGEAWGAAFKPPESKNERTFICGFWPTWVAASHKEAYLQGLRESWAEKRNADGDFLKTPLWTYFDIAEAHQWLYLSRPDRVWATLRWFWNHQASPGLYAWWEGANGGKVYRRWERVRGWINPPHVTPHYWTAAEMLLLQLDMMAYVNKSESTSTLIIGAGIPTDWFKQAMSVKSLRIEEGGQVDWSWDTQRMKVKIRSKKKMNVRLGSSFPEGTPLHIDYVQR